MIITTLNLNQLWFKIVSEGFNCIRRDTPQVIPFFIFNPPSKFDLAMKNTIIDNIPFSKGKQQ